MAYPILRLDGQYTLKRVLTLPNNTSAPLTVTDIDKFVTLDTDGSVKLATDGSLFFGILRTVSGDGFVTVDFSGVHKVEVSDSTNAGDRLLPKSATTTQVVVDQKVATTLVALTNGSAGEKVSAFFLI